MIVVWRSLLYAATVNIGFLSAVAAQEEQLGAVEIGETLTLQREVCDLVSDRSDRSSKGTLALPSGFVVLGVDPEVTRRHDANFSMGQYSEPGLIPTSELIGLISSDGNLSSSFGTINDTVLRSAIQRAFAAIFAAGIVDPQRPATIPFSCHAEGQRFSPDDGRIRVVLNVTVQKRVSLDDIQDLLAAIADYELRLVLVDPDSDEDEGLITAKRELVSRLLAMINAVRE